MAKDTDDAQAGLPFEGASAPDAAREQGASGRAPSRSGRDLAKALLDGLQKHKKALSALGRSLKNLDGRWKDPQVVEKELAVLRETGPGLPAPLDEQVSALVAVGEDWLAEERRGRRGRLSRELKAAAAEQGVELRVVTKEPLELRLAPLTVALDLEKGRATLLFGRQTLTTCPTDAIEIMTARKKALAGLQRKGWTAEGFHQELRQAWRAVAGRGDWVELADVLPQLAFAVQTAHWRRDPSSRNFTEYGKAKMLYELYRIKEEGILSQNGWRLSLGPATGGSTRDKARVFWVEDASGRGAYHLTMRFVKDEES